MMSVQNSLDGRRELLVVHRIHWASRALITAREGSKGLAIAQSFVDTLLVPIEECLWAVLRQHMNYTSRTPISSSNGVPDLTNGIGLHEPPIPRRPKSKS